MTSAKKKFKTTPDIITVGLFSKMDAALKISEGIRHLHSTVLGTQDSCVAVTQTMIEGKRAHYPWEIFKSSPFQYLTKSSERHPFIEKMLTTTQFGKTLQNRNRLKSVAEELLSNAFFHAYQEANGEDKYKRQLAANLAASEAIGIGFCENKSGIHLVIEDQGGNLTFDKISSSFLRCYGSKNEQDLIEHKASGAGLGLFMVFETITHLHIQISRSKRTLISCWLSSNNFFDPDTFSFNFFEETSK